MNKLIALLMFSFLFQACSTSQNIFELSPQQSMLMTGKGPGQDGAINPYSDTKSISVVENMGKSSFSVRIKDTSGVVKETPVPPKKTLEFVLEKGDQLYLDTENKSKAKITFKKFS